LQNYSTLFFYRAIDIPDRANAIVFNSYPCARSSRHQMRSLDLPHGKLWTLSTESSLCALVIGDDCIIKSSPCDNDWTLTLAEANRR